jgi:hypothetical protein
LDERILDERIDLADKSACSVLSRDFLLLFGEGGKGKASLREAREKGKGEREKTDKSFPFSL